MQNLIYYNSSVFNQSFSHFTLLKYHIRKICIYSFSILRTISVIGQIHQRKIKLASASIIILNYKQASNNQLYNNLQLIEKNRQMNNQAQKFQKALQKVRQLSSQGDKLQQKGNYEQAAKCYHNVTTILRAVVKQTTKAQTIQTIQQKIQKYNQLAKEMLVKQKQSTTKTRITFGFPQNRVTVQEKKIQPTLPKNQPKHYKTQIDPDVVGLVAKDIKANFSDIVGMSDLKQILYEAVIIPQKRPDLFEGIRSPPSGILLYGPPGNGKTFITKALAKQSGCTFFGISAGSIVNKFVGQSQKTLKKVFEAAKKSNPAIIFIDEIDSMLTARSESDNDAARRLKTEFLVQFDNLQGCRVIVIGATNLPNELDLAALRRFNKLVYVGLPDKQSRRGIVQKNLGDIKSEINNSDMNKLVKDLEGYSASQITDIVKQACMMPIREISKNSIETVHKSKLRAVKYEDFVRVLKLKKPLLSKQDLKKYQGKFK